MSEKEYLKLIKNMPDSMSDEYLQFMRDRVKVVYEDIDWIIVENIKYHTLENPHYTAFTKDTHNWMNLNGLMLIAKFKLDIDSWFTYRNHTKARSIERNHVHFVKNYNAYIRRSFFTLVKYTLWGV